MNALPRLRELATRARTASPPALADADERCALCATPVATEHPHLIDVRARTLLCACRACAVLFDRRAAGMGQYRRVPERRRRLTDVVVSDTQWAALGVPVAMAFFSYSTAIACVVGYYPGPLGATEAIVDTEAWRAIEVANPVVGTLEHDVEALLVDRRGEPAQHWLVGIDVCYALVGLIRRHWKGLGGGEAVREQIAHFFETLRERE
jgi:hypothetical protein